MIVLDNVSKTFNDGETYAVQELSLEVAEGETLVLVGSSGCGKTTTLKMINRLVDLSSGRIEVDGENVLEQDPVTLRRSVGYVFQGIGLFPHLTVEENITAMPRLLGWSRDDRRERARELLEQVGLPPDDYASRFPDELSGGQQQRVGVARALVADPAYLLMDEPFGALDAVTRDSLQKELKNLKEELNKTIVFVTHDILEAITLADRIAVLHDGELQQVGTVQEVSHDPANEFVDHLFAKPAEQLEKFEALQR